MGLMMTFCGMTVFRLRMVATSTRKMKVPSVKTDSLRTMTMGRVALVGEGR
jgi:hypothetical protein